MTHTLPTIDRLNWTEINEQLDMEGYAVLPGLLGLQEMRTLSQRVDASGDLHRVTLASDELGRGELFYFDESLPTPLATWREIFYQHLARIANRWNETLDVSYRYPEAFENFLEYNRRVGQIRMQSHISRLHEHDYQALHQRNQGEHVFPMQLVALLSEPGRDFTGGEFVMTEQRPRMQSRPMVLPLKLGDAAIITTAQRPFKGARGYYRVNLKHAISRVRSGERIGLELMFHDAP
jgi:hypothetical protein